MRAKEACLAATGTGAGGPAPSSCASPLFLSFRRERPVPVALPGRGPGKETLRRAPCRYGADRGPLPCENGNAAMARGISVG